MNRLLAALFIFWPGLLFGANPSFQDFFGTNGLVIRTNGNKVQVDGFLMTTNFIWTTNASYIFPRAPTNSIHIHRTLGNIIIGTNGIGTSVDAEVFRAVADTTMGDPSARTWILEANTTGAGTYGGALFNVNASGDALIELYNHLGTGSGLVFDIRAANGVTPFAFDATVNHTSGSLLSVSNLNVGKFDIAHNGMIWSQTNRFAFNGITNVWPLTNGLAGQVLTTAGGAAAQLGWTTVSASGPTFADLVWTNSAGTIQTTGSGANTNAIFVLPSGGIVVGTNSSAWWPAESGRVFLSQSLTSRGEPNNRALLMGVADEAVWDTFLELKVSTNQTHLKISHEPWGTVLLLDPLASQDGFFMNAVFPQVAGSILNIQNSGVTHLTLQPTNGITTPAITAYGLGSSPWQFGNATNTVNVQLEATNMLTVTVGTTKYAIPAKILP